MHLIRCSPARLSGGLYVRYYGLPSGMLHY